MKKKVLLLSFLLFGTILPLYSQTGNSLDRNLFNVSEQVNENSIFSDPGLISYHIELNTNLLQNSSFTGGVTFEVPLGDDFSKIHEFEIIRSVSYFERSQSVIAKATDGSGSLMMFTTDRSTGFFVGKVVAEDLKSEMDIRYDPESESAIIHQTDLSGNLLCSFDNHKHTLSSTDLSTPETGFQINESRIVPSIEALASEIEEEITVDLLLVYSPAAKTWAEGRQEFGSIENLISQAMILSQGAFDNSGVSIELRLVRAEEVNFSENSEEFDSTTDRLKNMTAKPDFNPWEDEGIPSDQFLEVHDFRNESGADVVAGILDIDDTGGVAWRLPVVSGVPELGFSMNRVQQVGFGFTLVHEIGHNLGLVHDRDSRSAAPAGEVGGMFEYSAGFLWEESTLQKFQTIMSQIPQDLNFRTVQHFSNPSISFQGNPTGTNSGNGLGPANAALSLNQAKRSVSFYRLSVTDSPVLSASEDFIEIDINREDSFTFPLQISNNAASGEQPLVWNLDFDFSSSLNRSSGLTKQIRGQSLTSEWIELKEIELTGSSESQSSLFSPAAETGEIFTESFAMSDGFSSGETSATGGWRGFSDNEVFNISGVNPSNGSLHFRFTQKTESSNAIRVQSPYFGPQPFGAFEFSADISISPSTSNQFERYDVLMRDDNTGEISAGAVFFTDGFIYVRNLNQEGGVGFSQTVAYDVNVYRNLKITYDPDDEIIRYFYDNSQIATTPYTTGKKLDSFLLINTNNVSGATFDIDNISISRPFQPFSWLEVEKQGGVVAPGETEDLMLNFQSFGKEEGTFEADLILSTNDPAAQTKTIPVRLNVNNTVSNEEDPEIPREIKLEQNFPNPFNPSTIINFELNRAANVFLEVYNVVGQKVATLLNDETRSAGRHTISFDGSSLSSGIYIYRLVTPQESLTKRMTLIK